MSSIIMPRGIIKPPGLVLDLPMQGEIVGPDLFDPGAGGFETDTGSWIVYGTNTIEVSTDKAQSGTKSLKITYVDNGNGAYLYFRDAADLISNLVVGKKYRLICWAAVNAGSVDIRVRDGVSEATAATITSTSMVKVEYDFIAQHATDAWIRQVGMSAGEILYLDDLALQELYTADVSGLGNHGTVDGPTVAQGLHGGCYSFTTDDLITIPNNASLNFGSGDFTIMQLIKGNAISGTNNLVSKGSGGAPGTRYSTYFNSNGTLVIEIDDATTAKTVTTALAYDDDTWVWFTGERDGNNLRAFINEIEDANSPTDITGYGDLDDATMDLVLGRFSGSAANFLTGSINKVLIFKGRVLTEAQIHYEMYRNSILKPVMNGGVLWPN